MAHSPEHIDPPQGKSRSTTCRIIIYPKDIQLLTGKSYRYAIDLNKEIRTHFKKQDHHLLTIYEFAEYTGIDPHTILSHIK